jgi:hypothetical protein
MEVAGGFYKFEAVEMSFKIIIICKCFAPSKILIFIVLLTIFLLAPIAAHFMCIDV